MPPQFGFKITKLFHPTSMVYDLSEVADFYGRVFGVVPQNIPYSDQARCYRSLAIVADACIENISPEQTHLSQFRMYLDILGNHWYFPCFYVADMQDAVYQLHHRRRIRLTASGTGNAVVGLPPGGSSRTLLYTHPADTGIMWEFWEGDQEWFLTNPLADPRMKPGWSLQPPAPDDPMGAELLSHQTVVVSDPKLALGFLVDVCGGKVFAEEPNEALATASIWVAVGEDVCVFEIARPVKDGPCLRDLEAGNTVHSLTFKVRNFDRTLAHLARQGIGLETCNGTSAVTDPRTSVGLRFGFSQSFHPNDPRNVGHPSKAQARPAEPTPTASRNSP